MVKKGGNILNDPWCLDLSVFSHLLIVLIYTIHGILIGLLDLGDESALGFPVAVGHHSSACRAHLTRKYAHNNLKRAKKIPMGGNWDTHANILTLNSLRH